MMSFQEFFNETARGEKQSKDGIFWKDARGRKNLNIVPDVNKVDADESASIIDNVIGGITTSKVATPDLLQHIQTTYKVDLNNLAQPKTLGNSKVEVYSVRGSNGQPIIMLRRKS
jgi:hypothetical protein